MAFLVSPGVLVTEKDLTNVVPAVSTSIGGVVVVSEKGPMDEVTLISSEDEYVVYLVNQMLTLLNIFLRQPTFYNTEML